MNRPAVRAVWWLAAVLLLAAVAASLWFLADRRPSVAEPNSRRDFVRWLSAEPSRPAEFAEFQRYLAAHDVSGVVRAWQLTRTDNTGRRRCKRPSFLLPPRSEWGNIVPVLRLLRDSIKPRLGDLEVVSAYRTAEFNECVGGARHSRHLSFSAVDLMAPAENDTRNLFRTLCKLQEDLGSASRFGLGAYFDPESPHAPNSGRFHVDVSGYRSWGYSKHAGSSGCRYFRDVRSPPGKSA